MNYLKAISMFDIVNKSGERVGFKLNSEQQRFLSELTGRDVILKSRQIGFSSLILALFTVDFLTVENSRSVCISHDSDSATRLFDRVKFFIRSAQDKGLETHFKYNSRNELVNELNNATFYIGSANNSKSFLRGETVSNLHLSEIAYYPDPKSLFAGAVQAVVPTGRVILESTANGMNWLREFYYKSKQGETGYKTHFFSRDFYSLDFLEQKRRELADEELFNQEYPESEESAFISSGRPFFNLETLNWYERLICEPRKEGFFARSNPVTFQASPGNYWKLWSEAERGESYVVGADIGEKSDYCAAVVVKTRTKEVVATFHGRLDAGEYGLQLALAGKYFNEATIAPEKNGLGMGVLTVLKELDYPRIYTRKSFDKLTDKETEEQGWLTTSTTRPLMLSDLQMLINAKELKLYDGSFLEELKHFIRNEKSGKPEAERGNHDDRVMALSIASRLLTENPVNNSFDEVAWEASQFYEQQEFEARYGRGGF